MRCFLFLIVTGSCFADMPLVNITGNLESVVGAVLPSNNTTITFNLTRPIAVEDDTDSTAFHQVGPSSHSVGIADPSTLNLNIAPTHSGGTITVKPTTARNGLNLRRFYEVRVRWLATPGFPGGSMRMTWKVPYSATAVDIGAVNQ